MTAAVVLCVERRVTTVEFASAPKPRPPYDSGMMIPMNFFFLMKSQASGERSPRWCTSWSSTSAMSSRTSLSTNACSRAESGFGANASMRAKFGAPEKSSASHQTVPASSAVRSVSLILGKMRASARITGGVTTARRSGARPKSIARRSVGIASARKSGVVAAPGW